MNNDNILKNLFFNILLKILEVIFPFIILSYAARILMPEGLGFYEFLNSIFSLLVLLSSLGITIYGTKVISSFKDNSTELQNKTTELFFISLISSLLVSFCYIIIIIFLKPDLILFYFLGLFVVFGNLFSSIWFFQGIEDFKHIFIRNLFIKILYFISVITFVKSNNDLLIFSSLSTFSILISGLINYYRMQIYLKGFFRLNLSNVFKHFKSLSFYFLFSLSTSFYILFDKILLGLIVDNIALGNYSIALRIIKLITLLISSFSIVLLPKFSYLHGKKNFDLINLYSNKTIFYIAIFAFPAMFGVFMYSDQLVFFIFGESFTSAAMIIRILSFLILPVSISSFLGIQLFLSINKEIFTFFSTFIGAIAFLLISVPVTINFGIFGISILLVFTEYLVMFLQIVFLSKLKFIRINFFQKVFLKIAFSFIFFALFVFIIKNGQSLSIYYFIFEIFSSIIIYFLLLHVFGVKLYNGITL